MTEPTDPPASWATRLVAEHEDFLNSLPPELGDAIGMRALRDVMRDWDHSLDGYTDDQIKRAIRAVWSGSGAKEGVRSREDAHALLAEIRREAEGRLRQGGRAR